MIALVAAEERIPKDHLRRARRDARRAAEEVSGFCGTATAYRRRFRRGRWRMTARPADATVPTSAATAGND